MEEKVSVIEMGALVRGQGNRIWNNNCPTLRAEMGDNQPCVLMDQGGGVMNVEYDKTGTLRSQTHGHEPIIMEDVFPLDMRNACRGDKQECGVGIGNAGDPQYTISAGGRLPTIATHSIVRRLTPVECERLQGFPDNYTNIPRGNKKSSPDAPRYKALGNSMAVPVMLWIGKRIQESQPVVYNEDAIRNAMIKPLSQEERDIGQLGLF